MPTAFVTYTTTPTETITPLGTDTIGPTATVTLTQTLTETVSLTASVTVIPIPSATCTITPSLTITLTPSVTDAQVTVLPPSQTPTRTFTPKPPATRSPTYFKITVLTPSATIGWIPSKATTTIPQAANTSIPSKSKTPMPSPIVTQLAKTKASTSVNVTQHYPTFTPKVASPSSTPSDTAQIIYSETPLPSSSQIPTNNPAIQPIINKWSEVLKFIDSAVSMSINFLSDIVRGFFEAIGSYLFLVTILGSTVVIFSVFLKKLPLNRFTEYINNPNKSFLRYIIFKLFISKLFLSLLKRYEIKYIEEREKCCDELINDVDFDQLENKKQQGKTLNYYEELKVKKSRGIIKKIDDLSGCVFDIQMRISIIERSVSTEDNHLLFTNFDFYEEEEL
jgi:hypothetical protein